MHSFTDSGFRRFLGTETKETDKRYNNFDTGWKVLWLVHLGRNKEFWTPFYPHLQCEYTSDAFPKHIL